MMNIASPTLPASKTDISATQLSVKFWGVRGSVPTPAQTHQKYGGNTICVEALLGTQRVIFDGGTGIVALGHNLQQREESIHAHVFFTHTQWDRIQGFPFFQPAFEAKNHFSIYGGTAPNGASIKHCLTDQMLKPHFSMPLQNMQAGLAFHTLLEQDQFNIGDISVEVAKTNEQTEAFGYRLTCQNRTLVYATDTPVEGVNDEFLQFVEGADILLYDGTYSDLTYLCSGLKEGLKPWEMSAAIAQKAQVKQLVLLHHSPVQNDQTLDHIQQQMHTLFPNALVAKEGMSVRC